MIGRALCWTALRVCLLFTSFVGWVRYKHFCYSDTVPLFGAQHHLDIGA